MKSIFRPILQSISNLIKKILPVSNISNYSLLIVALLLSACKGSGSVDALLRQAEDSVMVNAAYTAAMLDTLPVERLTTASQRALYGLLLTQSHTRLHDTIPSDSLISSAVSYYEDHGSDRRLMLSLYYLGQTRLDHGQYAQALVPLLRSYEMALNASEHHWAGMTARALSDLYFNTYDREEALEMANREFDYFNKEGDSLFIAYAYLDKAICLSNNLMYEESLALIDTVLNIGLEMGDPNLYCEAMILKGTAHMGKEEWNAAAETYMSVAESDMMSAVDSIRMAHAYILSGEEKKGLLIADAISLNDDIYSWTLKYEIYNHIGEKDIAFDALKKIDSLNNEILTRYVKANILGELQNYHYAESALHRRNMEKARWNIIAVIALGVIILLSVVYIMRRRRRKIQNDFYDALSVIEEIYTAKREADSEHLITERKLQSTEIALDTTRAELESAKAELHSTQASLDSVEATLRNTVDTLNQVTVHNTHTRIDVYELLRLNYSYFDNLLAASETGDVITQKKMLKQINATLDELISPDGTFSQLTSQIDKYTDGLISRFRSALPNLVADDYRLFVFSLLGFSNRSLMVLLRINDIQSLYQRRRRLKEKIKTLSPIDQTDFLTVLNYKNSRRK